MLEFVNLTSPRTQVHRPDQTHILDYPGNFLTSPYILGMCLASVRKPSTVDASRDVIPALIKAASLGRRVRGCLWPLPRACLFRHRICPSMHGDAWKD